MATDAEYVASLSLDLADLEKGIAQVRAKLSQVGQGVKPAGVDSFLGEAVKKIRAFGEEAERVGRSLSISVTLPLTLLGKKIFDVGRDYEQAMNTFQAVTRASAGEMDRAAKVAQQLGADMTLPATSAGDAALAMTELAKGGLSAAQAMDAARGVLQLAAAAQIEEARAAEITANALNAFGLSASEATRVADMLAAASNASSAEINDIALAMQQSSASAAQLKIPMDDLVTAIGLMANAGIKGSDAGTSLKVMMTRLLPETEKAAIAMGKLGIDAFDAQGKFIGFEAVIKQAAPALAKMTDEQRQHAIQVAFGQDAMRAANIVLGQGVEKFKAMEEAVNRSGAAAELAGAKTKGLGGAWDGLVSQLETVALKVFSSVSGGLEGIVRKAADLIGALGDLDPAVFKFGATVAAVAASAGPIALLIGRLAQLDAKGAIVLGVIAGAAAMAGAYTTGMGDMDRAVDHFVNRFRGQSDSLKQSTFGVSEAMSYVQIALIDLFDMLATKVEEFVDRAKIAFGIMRALATQQWSEVGRIYSEGIALIDKNDKEFNDRRLRRQNEYNALLDGGMQAYFLLLAARHAKGGGDANKAFIDAYGNPTENVLKSMRLEVEKQTPAIVERFNILGRRSLAAHREGIEQRSPSGYEKDIDRIMTKFIEFPAKLQAEVAPKLKDAGKQMLKDMREAFDEMIDRLNVWSKATEVGIEFTAELWAKLPKEMRRSVVEQQKAHKQMEDGWREMTARIALLQRGMFSTAQKEMADFANNSIRNIGALNIEIAKSSSQFRTWEEDIDETIATTARMEKEISKLKDQMRALIGVFDENIDYWKLAIIEMTRLAGAVKYSAEQIPGFEDAMRKGERATEELTKEQEALRHKMEEVTRRIPDSVNKILDAFGKLSLRTKSIFADIFDIIGLLPGKVGSALQRAVNEFERWFTLIDKVVRVVERVFGENETEGIVGIIKSALGKVGVTINNSGATIQNSLQKVLLDAMNGASNAASKAGATIGISLAKGIAGSLAVAIPSIVGGLFGARGQGAFQGALSGGLGALGAALGIGSIFKSGVAALFTGPAAPFVLGGIGLFAGLGALFGRKSAAEKERERLQQQQLRDQTRISQEQVKQAIEQTKQSFLQTAEQARQLLEGLLDFTKVPKKTIKDFFANLRQVMNEFAKEAERWKTESLEKTKALAEAMGPVVQTIGVAVQSLSLMHGFLPVADRIIDDFFNTLKTVVEKFGALAEEIPNKLERHAKRFANRIEPVIGVIADAVQAFASGENGLANIKAIPAEAFENLKAAIHLAVIKMEEIAFSIDNSMVKAAQRFSEKAGTVVGLVGEAVGNFANLKEFVAPTPEIFESLFAAIKEALTRMNNLAETLSTEFLGRAEMIAVKSMAVVNFIGAAAQAFTALREYSKIPEENIKNLLDDFKRALDLLQLLLSDADRFEQMAVSFRDKIQRGSAAMLSGIQSFSTSFLGAASALTGALGGVQGGAGGASTSSLAFTPSFVIASPTAGPSAPPSSTTSTTVVRHFHGDIIIPPPAGVDLETFERFRIYVERYFREMEATASVTAQYA